MNIFLKIFKRKTAVEEMPQPTEVCPAVEAEIKKCEQSGKGK